LKVQWKGSSHLVGNVFNPLVHILHDLGGVLLYQGGANQLVHNCVILQVLELLQQEGKRKEEKKRKRKEKKKKKKKRRKKNKKREKKRKRNEKERK